MQGIPLVLETPSFESATIWTKEIEVLNQLSTIDDTDGVQAAMAAMKTAIEDVVKTASGGANTSKMGAKVGNSKSSAKGGRAKTEENEGNDGEPHGH